MVDEHEIDLLLITLVQSEAVAHQAIEWLRPDHILEAGGHAWQAAILSALIDQITTNGEIGPLSYFLNFVHQFALRNYGDQATADAAASALRYMTRIEPNPNDAWRILQEIRSQFVDHQIMQQAYMQAMVTKDWTELQRTVAGVVEASARMGDPSADTVDPFEVLDKLDAPIDDDDKVNAPRLFTNTPLDVLHAGKGMYVGYSHLLLGPTSGGKTVMANLLAANLSSQNRSVGLLSTEESVVDDINARARLWAACCQSVSVDEWVSADCDPRRLSQYPSEAEIARLQQVRANCKFYRFDDEVNWDVVEIMLDSYAQRQGKMHDLVILDWAGPLALAMVEAGIHHSQHDALEAIQRKAFQRVAKKYGCSVLVMHQLNAEKCEKAGMFGRYSEYDAQNCKKMTQHAAATYVLAPRDEGKSERCRFIGCKTRFDPKGTEIVARLDYQRGRFVHEPEVHAVSGMFVNNNQQSGVRMPGMSGGVRNES